MDIRTSFLQSPTGTRAYADWTVANGQLAMDGTFETAVNLSLFSDADAPEGIEVPEGLSPRIWWGQAYWPLVFQRLGIDAGGVQLGSLLWTLQRAKQTEQTRTLAIEYSRMALWWMVTVGLAKDVIVTGEWMAPRILGLVEEIIPPVGLPIRFANFWRMPS
ncbi:MAG: phage GP46 family protein, partial [Magnetospirillum sp.]|nr:phage GP46 family protein [Magnetospirillum sp.]